MSSSSSSRPTAAYTGTKDVGTERFTSFDAVSQDALLARHMTWTGQRCLQEAIDRSLLPLPTGRISTFAVPSLPLPQVILSQTAMRHTHHTVVLLFGGDALRHGSPPAHSLLVADVPLWLSLHDFLFSHRVHDHHVRHLFPFRDQLACLVNGQVFDCYSPVPRSADVIHIAPPGNGIPAYNLLSSESPVQAVRPPTPPIPTDLPADSLSDIPFQGLHSDHEACPEQDFVVFDVYHHARLLPCPSTASPTDLIQTALAHTPQIGVVYGSRWAHFCLPGLPRRQLILWGDKLPDSCILPISFGRGVGAVCTIEVLFSYSAIQIVGLACRICQLPDSILESVAELESSLWINEARCYPLDPNAGSNADTARLIGPHLPGLVAGSTFSVRNLRPQPSASSSSSHAVNQFIRDLSDAEAPPGSHFVAFGEPNIVHVLPIPAGVSMADLVYQAFARFPSLATRCGHRVLSRPVLGLPNIQVCVWDNLAVDQRVLQFIANDAPGVIFTVRCRSVATPFQVAATSTCLRLRQASQGLSVRTCHLVADGIPLQPTHIYLFRHFEVLRLRDGPPPSRIPGLGRFLRDPIPDSLDCVSIDAVTDAEPCNDIVVHQLGTVPCLISAEAVLRPVAVAQHAAALLGRPLGTRLRFPLTSPLVHGTPSHAVLASGPSDHGNVFAICDFRRILRPPFAPFQTLDVPIIVNSDVLADLLGQTLSQMAPVRAIFVDQDRLQQSVSVACAACTITFVGWQTPSLHHQGLVIPAVLDTFQATAWRGGFRPTFAFAGRAFPLPCTSTSTTTTRPIAGTGSLGSTDSSSSPDEGDSLPSSASVGSRVSGPYIEPATNPNLLDFVQDSLAIHRLDPTDLPKAFSLFDSVYQTRLAYRDPSWSAADCLAEATRHFRHLGPGAILRIVADEVAGLPSPQIAAIAAHQHPSLRALPIDARPVSRGICVVDVPVASSPYTAVYWAKSLCPVHSLPPQLARGAISARAFGRHLPPFLDMAAPVDALCLWPDAAPPRARRAQTFPADVRDTLQDVRDITTEASQHDSTVAVMLHLPGGPPVQAIVQRHHSLDDMEDIASTAIWLFNFHGRLRLHLPGAFPRGTDALLHFLVELDGCCAEGYTIFLFDGRPLGPAGPPFRSAILPRQLSLSALLSAANELFPDARAANSLRVNGRLVTRWEARDYAFPLVRLLLTQGLSVEPGPSDGSCLPVHAFLSHFPGIAIAQQQQHDFQVPSGSATAVRVEFIRPPPRRSTASGALADEAPDPVPFVFEVALPSPLAAQCELVVLSLHFTAFRIWIPSTYTMHQLRSAIGDCTGQRIGTLRWPRVIPCLAGSPLVVIATLAQDDISQTLGIVDARRLHPLQGSALWLVALPDEIFSQELTAVALAGYQVVQTPQYARVDGRRCVGLLRFRRGVFVLTLSAAGACEEGCTDRQHPSHLPLGLQMSVHPCPGVPSSSSTTTTTVGAPCHFQASTTSTTTSACLGHSGPRVTFYVTSGLLPAIALHAGDTLDCADLLSTAAFHFSEMRVSPVMTTWLLSKRAFRLHTGRWAIFICSGYATHEPVAASVWIDVGSAWPHPYMIHVPSYATWEQVKSRIFVSLDPKATVTVNGVVWDGACRFFANGFVIQVRDRAVHLMSKPLLHFADRFHGLLALQCVLDGPATVGWSDLPPDTRRARYSEHFRRCLQLMDPVSECLPSYASVVLFVQGTGIFRFTVGTPLPPHADAVQSHFDRFLAPRIGEGVVQDLKYVWDEHCLFLVRLPAFPGSLWIHLDGALMDFFELDDTQDLSLIPTFAGHILYPMDVSGDFGFAIRRPLEEAEAAVELPGPSRLRHLAVTLSGETAAIADPSKPTCDADAQALYELFGTPPDSDFSSMNSSELAALAASTSPSPERDTGSSSSNDTSTGSSDCLTVSTNSREDDATGLLQLTEARRMTKVSHRRIPPGAAEPPPDVSAFSTVEVFRMRGDPILLQLDASASFGQVRARLEAEDPNLCGCALFPVFPAQGATFQCIATSVLRDASSCPCLVEWMEASKSELVTLPAACTAAQLRSSLNLPDGSFHLSGHGWRDSSSGFIPGMRLVFVPSLRSAVGGTTPLSVEKPASLDGVQDCMRADVAYAPATVRAVPTPQRSFRKPTASHHGHAICLADCVPPPSSAFALGVEHSMIAFCLAGHASTSFTVDLPDSDRLTPRLRCIWHALPLVARGQRLDELFLFTDGSFDPHSGNSGWAVVAFARVDHILCKVGAAWGRVSDLTGESNAYLAEMEALLHAEAFAAAVPANVTHLAVDCSSALQVGTGYAATQPNDQVAKACIGLQVLSASLGRCCRHHKVAAHANCIPNEIADALAKCATFDGTAAPHPASWHSFWDSVKEGILEWLWVVLHCSTTALPFLSDFGGWSLAACEAAVATTPSTVGTIPPPSDPSVPFPFSLRVVQYNCLSMKGQAACDLISRGLQRHKVHIAGFQETRTGSDGIRQEGEFWVVSSPCNSRGQGGCQLWLHRNLSLTTKSGLCSWDRKSMMIVRSSPRLLVLLVDVGPFKFACISAHAPTSRSSEDEIHGFWDGLSSAVGRLPKSSNVILCIDGNARFHRSADMPATLESEPDGHNATCLKHLCSQHALDLSAQFTHDGEPLFSWTSPTGTRSLIDYVAVPVGWKACLRTRGNIALGDLHEGVDHEPIIVQCYPTLEGRKVPARFHVPRGALDTEEGCPVERLG